MTKKQKEILQNCHISVKWNNMGTWTKEDYTNLLEMVEKEKVKITGSKKDLIINWRVGVEKLRYKTTEWDLARDLCTMLAQKCLYLGDTTKIITPFKDWSI
jgi:hypothetical protein